jgi:hypothetical protein
MTDSDPAPKPRKPLGYARVLAVCVIFGLLVGGASGFINDMGGEIADPLRVILLAITVVFVLGVSLIWWRGADEAVREAHKWAWYWGGSVGIIGGMIVFALLSWDSRLIALPPLEPANAVMIGMALILGLQLIGYTVAWAWWWLSRR